MLVSTESNALLGNFNGGSGINIRAGVPIKPSVTLTLSAVWYVGLRPSINALSPSRASDVENIFSRLSNS